MAARKKAVRIRMYNVGLGDSFLLRFPCTGGERKVLIDCGVHQVGPGPHRMADVVAQILDDVQGRIDVVIASHRHRDHVSGFADERWHDVEVGEVWLPWTEDRKDPQATGIRELQSAKAERVSRALRLAAAPDEVQQLADNCLTNAEAMAMLHGGFAGKPKVRFLPPKTRSRQTFLPELLPGVTVHAMGPSRDREVIRDMNPPKGESYLRLAETIAGGGATSPFDARYHLSPSGDAFAPFLAERFYASREFRPYDGTPLRVGDARFLDRWIAALRVTHAELRGIEKIAENDPLALVVALDQAVNGTSLMLMFEMRRAFLLFPGDAQWGTWQGAMTDPEWRRLLGKTTFYKVGHHGSHNATPVDFVEEVLGTEFSAMVCTRPTTKFKEIPRIPLLDSLRERSGGRVVRSDEAGGMFADEAVPI
jgi:beta-lactamase superfamily II metal-dependent hydrolase